MNKEYDYYGYFDGACGPRNPGGEMGVGVVIMNVRKEIVYEYSYSYPPNKNNSNNVAEYLGVTEIFRWAIENMSPKESIKIYGDSNLVIKQLSRRWKIKNGLYIESARNAFKLLIKLMSFAKVYFEWIPREQNTLADELSKRDLGQSERTDLTKGY